MAVKGARTAWVHRPQATKTVMGSVTLRPEMCDKKWNAFVVELYNNNIFNILPKLLFILFTTASEFEFGKL